jgi:thiosulfate/3-mercaptopyruvate sulfurtransferase
MRKITSLLILLYISVQTFAVGDFISVKEASEKLKDPNCLFVDAREEKDFKLVHITNAINLPIEELSSKEPIEGILKSNAEIVKILGENGIDLNKELILYCAKGNNSGRMYWILKMLGAQKVKLLDGNIDAWKAERKPVTKNPTVIKKTTVTAQMNTKTLLNIDDVKTKMGNKNAVLVDARADAYFNGTDPKSTGHIPGAISINSDLMKDDKGLLKSSAELKKLFESKGVTSDKEVILYCQTSTRAGLLYTVLTSMLNYPNVKIYDGAYNEWVAKGNKVEK